MNENPYPIAPEGLPFMGIALVMTLGCWYFFGLTISLIPFLGFLFCVWFFRDPLRKPPGNEAVISPADGVIVDICETQEHRFVKQKTKRVSIFMSPLNVHVNRAPVSGEVQDTAYNPGKFFNARGDKASLDNEQHAIYMKTKAGIDVIFVQIAGFIARRIICYAKGGDNLAQGQRMGLIRFGSRVDVYLPLDAKIEVGLDQKVRAGESVLANL